MEEFKQKAYSILIQMFMQHEMNQIKENVEDILRQEITV